MLVPLLLKQFNEEVGGILHKFDFWNTGLLVLLSTWNCKSHCTENIPFGTGEGLRAVRVREHLRAVNILLQHREKKLFFEHLDSGLDGGKTLSVFKCRAVL